MGRSTLGPRRAQPTSQRHAETHYQLHKAIIQPEDIFDRATLRTWAEGTKTPRSVVSMEILARIEQRYDLPSGYFKVALAAGPLYSGFLLARDCAFEDQLPNPFRRRQQGLIGEVGIACRHPDMAMSQKPGGTEQGLA